MPRWRSILLSWAAAVLLGACAEEPAKTHDGGAPADTVTADASADAQASNDGPDASTEGTDADMLAPDADTPTPDADTPAPDADTPAPDADTPAPDADTPAPDADTPAPDADTPAPDADTPAPDAEAHAGDAAPEVDAGHGDDAGVSLDDGGPALDDAETPVVADASASDAELGADAEGDAGVLDGAASCPCTFEEPFTDPSTINAGLTTAAVVPAGTGTVEVPPLLSLLPLGFGAGGAFAPPSSTVQAPGSYDLASVTLTGVALQVPGDLTLSVLGDVAIQAGAALQIDGDLTIVAGGAISVDCASVLVGGRVTIHQHGAAGMYVGCHGGPGLPNGYVITGSRGAGQGGSGGITVWTQGALVLDYGTLWTGMTQDATSGGVELRAGGDVTLTRQSMVAAGDSHLRNGHVAVFTEGRLIVTQQSVIKAGVARGAVGEGGSLEVHALGDVELDEFSSVESAPAGDLTIESAGDLDVANGSIIQNSGGSAGPSPVQVRVRARGLRMHGGANGPNAGGIVYARPSQTGGSHVTVDVRDFISLRHMSNIGSMFALCQSGGNVKVRTRGAIEVLDWSFIYAGWSRANPPTCAASTGGDLLVIAGGAVTTAAANSLDPGPGSPPGLETVSPFDATYRFGHLGSGTAPAVVVTSNALPLDGARTVATWTVGPTSPPTHPSVSLALSPNVATMPFEPASELASPLMPGWGYQLWIEPRMFDAVVVEGLAVEYQ